MFIETLKPTLVDTKTRLEFLVQEGQIRADAVVRHVQAGHGMGLRFTVLSDGDRPRLAALMNRLGYLSPRVTPVNSDSSFAPREMAK
jgi:hypothetical protein